MAIAFIKYIDISSAVAGNSSVIARELIGRIMTTNPLLPIGTVMEADNADEVGQYFGTSSEEYFRAVQYFTFISKNITAPEKISYARYTLVDTAPLIYGGRLATGALASFQAISDGSFHLVISGTDNQISGLDFTAATSLADVASVIEAGINAESGTMWTAATVVYDATRGAFNFTGGDVGAATITASAGTVGTNIFSLMKWATSNGAIYSDGADAQNIEDTVADSANISDNFGSFLFIPTLDLDQITSVAQWNSTQNVKYQYYVPVSIDDYSSYSAALIDIAGVGLTISDISGEYPEQLPMQIIAATNYDAQNAVQNYMFQQDASITPSVTDTATSNSLDDARVNYYGRTQSAGQLIDFYQRGYLMGGSTDPLDMNTYANEQWLKSAAGASLMTLLLTVGRVPANNTGRAQILNTLQDVINQALFNGSISVGKTLNQAQKLSISQITGDPDAWYQVQSIGYWIGCVIVQNGSDYEARYTLVYSKDDVIRKVVGSQILI